MKTVIVDGYVDEPALLGVPPFISTYVRYAFAVYRCFGVESDYYTIDQVRDKNLWSAFDHYDQLMVIGGTTVPGKYAGGSPIQIREILQIGQANPHPLKLFFGPITSGYASQGGRHARSVSEEMHSHFECVITGNLETYLFHLLRGDDPDEAIPRENQIMDQIAPHLGALLTKHPLFPYIISEIELSTGCERSRHCSFCSEPLRYPVHNQRALDSVLAEVRSLAAYGGVYFRLGRTTNILAYGDQGNGPDPFKIHSLYQSIRELVPGLKVLHTDNAHVGYISSFPYQCEKIIEIISEYNTPGDSLSLGVESFDDRVLKANGKGFTSDQAIEAIRMINAIGSQREKGIPKLLPGINILFGLIGEDADTYSLNQQAFSRILDSGWMMRRINIRQAMVFPGTPLSLQKKKKQDVKSRSRFFRFKEWVRKEVDHVMLERVFPSGTMIEEVIPEYHEGMITFGRPVGSYPILVGIRERLHLRHPINISVTEHGQRSLTGIVYDSPEGEDR